MDVTGESYQGDKVTMTAWALDDEQDLKTGT